jgi:hypothetical protein
MMIQFQAVSPMTKNNEQPLLNTHLPFPREWQLTRALNVVGLHDDMCNDKYLLNGMFIDGYLLTKSLL